jgi:DNA-binding transcriptional regulator YiaG
MQTQESVYDYYLMYLMDNMGEMFEYAVCECGLDGNDFMDMFIASGIAGEIEEHSPKFAIGMSGTELAIEVMRQCGTLPEVLPPPASCTVPAGDYWAGWILAYYQEKTKKRYRTICETLPYTKIRSMYHPLHEADESRAAAAFDTYFETEQDSGHRLRQCRSARGFSQSKLAAESGVSLRSIQQYEQGTKDLGKAAAKTLFALAGALGVDAESLLG